MWITAKPGNEKIFHACYRKTFSLKTPPKRAELRIAAHQMYKCRINGRLVMVGPLRGARQWKFEDCLSVENYLREGANLLAIEVMDLQGQGEFHPGEPGFCLALTIKTGGVKQTIVSDGSWRCRNWKAFDQNAPAARGYPSETLDVARFDWRWSENEYSDASWPQVAQNGIISDPPQLKARPVRLPTLRGGHSESRRART